MDSVKETEKPNGLIMKKKKREDSELLEVEKSGNYPVEELILIVRDIMKKLKCESNNDLIKKMQLTGVDAPAASTLSSFFVDKTQPKKWWPNFMSFLDSPEMGLPQETKDHFRERIDVAITKYKESPLHTDMNGTFVHDDERNVWIPGEFPGLAIESSEGQLLTVALVSNKVYVGHVPPGWRISVCDPTKDYEEMDWHWPGSVEGSVNNHNLS